MTQLTDEEVALYIKLLEAITTKRQLKAAYAFANALDEETRTRIFVALLDVEHRLEK